MPKSQFIDPKEMRKAGEITFTPIPVNQYKKTIKDELKEKNFTKEDLKRIYHDMVVIREFETMLQLVKTTGGYNGVEYNNPGPAHLSAGQEAAAVGMAYMLKASENIPLSVFLMFPSCVPATPFEHAGAVLNAPEVEKYIDNPRVLGLGEMIFRAGSPFPSRQNGR